MIHEATRTLVKSPPEVWEQCSDAESLSRHLNGSFGEIRITRLEPESTVAWEGEHGSGTVRIEPSAWGTRVTLVAESEADLSGGDMEDAIADPPEPADPPPEPMEDPPEPVDDPPEPEPEPLPAAWDRVPEPSRERLARLLMRFRRGRAAQDAVPAAVASPVGPPEPEPDPEPETPPVDDAPDRSAVLMAALESMGQAHHRPYSRG